jgi:RimJ/RimL family protein N-acetyltransferase
MLDALRFPVPEHFETERLLLRTFALGDAPQLHEALAESIRDLRTHLWFLPWVAEEPTLQSATLRCQRALANYLLRTDLAYLAFNKQTYRLVGSVGLHRTDWSVPKTEVGYWLRSNEVGKGYATEAVQELTSWALETLGAKRVELVTDEGNAGSRAVAERCKFKLEGVLRNTMVRPDGSLSHSCVYARWPAPA